MTLNSLRHRLIALIGLCLIAMLTLVLSQVFYANRLIEAQNDTTLLLQLNNEILQLRRHEKDFMLRQDTHYVNLFNDRAENLEDKLDELESVFSSYALAAPQLESIRLSFKQYRGQFSDLVDLRLAIGINESSGQQGEFRRDIHALEKALKAKNLKSLSLLLLQLRRHEKDFLLRLDLSYTKLGQQTYQQLREALLANQLSGQVSLLDSYQQRFAAIVVSTQDIGLTPDSGLQGKFREAAHQMEAQLTKLSDTLTPLIQQREQDVKINGLIITSFTAIILLVLLVRNFAKLQNALSTFLLFFHQSKRGHLMLDVKKMGFTEFETLAVVANEMVSARQDTETELKEAKLKIRKLQAQAL